MKCNPKNYCCYVPELYKNLGKYFYNLLKYVQLPPGHPCLMEAIHRFMRYGLPPSHKSLVDILYENKK